MYYVYRQTYNGQAIGNNILVGTYTSEELAFASAKASRGFVLLNGKTIKDYRA